MKDTNRSWRAQKGATVEYASGRISGTGVVISVLAAPRIGIGDGEGRYLIRDTQTGQEHEVTGAQMRLGRK